jgi:hypothetical protein
MIAYEQQFSAKNMKNVVLFLGGAVQRRQIANYGGKP